MVKIEKKPVLCTLFNGFRYLVLVLFISIQVPVTSPFAWNQYNTVDCADDLKVFMGAFLKKRWGVHVVLYCVKGFHEKPDQGNKIQNHWVKLTPFYQNSHCSLQKGN